MANPATPALRPSGPDWDFLKKVTRPNSVASVGERMACITAGQTTEQVAAFLCDTEEGTLEGIVTCMIRAQECLKRRLDVVTAALDRLQAVEDLRGGANGSA